MKRTKWNKRKISEKLQKICKELKRTPSSGELREMGEIALFTACVRYFGSYEKATKYAGLKLYKRVYKEIWTKEKVIKTIQEFSKKYKRVPSRRDIIKFAGHSVVNAARRHFETWSKAVAKSGFKPNSSGCSDKWRRWTKRTVIKKLKDLKYSLGHSPTTSELDTIGLSGLVMACRRLFGSFPNALIAAGLETHKAVVKDNSWKIWENFVINIIKKIYPNVIIQKKLPNGRIPDGYVPQLNLIIEIKTNAIGQNVIEDIENYGQYGNMQIWYLRGDPNFYKNFSFNTKVGFVGPEQIRLILRRLNDENLLEEFNRVCKELN